MVKKQFLVEELKTRLDKFLAQQLKAISRSQIQREIEAGLVLVNGEVVKESKFVVRKDDTVVYHQQKKESSIFAAAKIVLKVLYDNHGLLIIDKPAGMVVHPGAGFKGETLASALLYQFKDIKLVGEEDRPGIVHRLDKDTSGVILVAKTQEMYEYLKDAFAERKVKKEYIALVSGRVEKPFGFIETPIGKSKRDFRKYDVKNIVEPKPSLTEYKVLEYLELGKGQMGEKGLMGLKGRPGVDQYTLILVKLHTGRTHQIRVHFNSIGHPLIGDSLYGHRLRGRSDSRSGRKSSLEGLSRQFLHAKRIEVRIPNGTWIEAESELPDDLKKVLISLNSKVVNQL
jgi:23S rRNA pseudouridine1911/1915/1917 synthase